MVKQTHLYTNEKHIMFHGVGEMDVQGDNISLSYIERDGISKVRVNATFDTLCIERDAELKSRLPFKSKEKTMGTILSEFGEIDIEIYTHKYIFNKDTIAVEYDIVQGDEVIDGYRIIWNMKEEVK